MNTSRVALVALSMLLGTASSQLTGCGVQECAANSTCAGPSNDAATAVDASEELVDAGPVRPEPFNPYGVPYPTKNLGWRARTLGSAGAVLPNLVLTGARPEPAKLGFVQMADLYDPEGRTHDAVILIMATAWEPVSKDLFRQLGAQPRRIAIVSVLGQGERFRKPATPTDLIAWRAAYPWAWHALDSNFVETFELQREGVPVIVALDARTMELCSAFAGSPSDAGAAFEDIADDIRGRPPAY